MNETIGVTRVSELENLLGEILDMYQRDELLPAYDIEQEDLDDVMNRAMTCLARGEEDEEGY